MSLADYGWGPFFAASFEPFGQRGLAAGRVVFQQRIHRLITGDGEVDAVVAGRLRRRGDDEGEPPVVGDWVAFEPAAHGGPVRIEAVLARKSQISRKVPGVRTAEQVVAANLDTVFLVMGLDGDYNPRRLERFLTLAWDSGASPVALLNKADLLTADELAERRLEIEEVALGVPVHVISCRTGFGLEALTGHLRPGETVALLGSSGAGKSTLINRLAGRELMKTGEVREDDDRGRHTTTHRELVRLPSGVLLIDNPGMREIQLWSAGEGLAEAFDDVEELATLCRFRDCAHQGEPGCAVEAAVAAGRLPAPRLASFRALQNELRYLERRQDEAAQREEQRRWRILHRAARKHKPRKL